MHSTIEQLLVSGPVVTDGAWGTQLQARGLPIGACPDAWNLSQPGRVEAVAGAYVEAGSQVILTNTFGSNRFVLAKHDLADRVEEVNRAGVEISRRAAGEQAKSLCLDGPQRRDADDGRGERGRTAGGVCRAGPRDGRRGGRRHRGRDDVRSGRSVPRRCGGQGDRPAGGRLHDVRQRRRGWTAR